MKELKAIAATLPASYVDIEVMRGVLGSKLLSEGITHVQGKPVKKDHTYLHKIAERVQVNDYKRLRKIYAKGGMKAVREYVEGVIDINTPKPVNL